MKAFAGIIIVAASIGVAFGVSVAAEVERVIPLVRDESGNGITVEISKDGSRQTATPCVSAARPAEEETASPCSIGTLRKRAARAKVSRPAVAVPEEITARNTKGVFKALRAALKEKRAALKVVEETPEPEPVRVASQR